MSLLVNQISLEMRNLPPRLGKNRIVHEIHVVHQCIVQPCVDSREDVQRSQFRSSGVLLVHFVPGERAATELKRKSYRSAKPTTIHVTGKIPRPG